MRFGSSSLVSVCLLCRPQEDISFSQFLRCLFTVGKKLNVHNERQSSATSGFHPDAVLMLSYSSCLIKVQQVQVTDTAYFESCGPLVALERFIHTPQLYTTTWKLLLPDCLKYNNITLLISWIILNVTKRLVFNKFLLYR